MSTTETSSPAPQGEQSPRRPTRLRRVLFASTLLVTGGVIGALVAAPTRVLGWHDGPSYGWFRDHGPPGWHGPGWGPGRMHGFFPGRIERAVDRTLDSIDASSEQRRKITGIADRTVDELFALREKHMSGRREIRDALAAATIDRAKVDALRAEQMQLAETASKRITDAFVEAAEVLTPEQRAGLARRIERWQRWFRG